MNVNSKRLIRLTQVLILVAAFGVSCTDATPIPTNPPTSTTAPNLIPTDTPSPTAESSDFSACLDSLPVYPDAQEVSRDDAGGILSYTSQDAETQVADYYRNNPISSNCTESPISRADPGALRMVCVNNNLNITIYVHAPANRQSGALIDFKCEP